MAETSEESSALLARRLDHLFHTVLPAGRRNGRPYTNDEVAEAINTAAGEKVISGSYVWQLRTGYRTNPSMRHLSALATFFGVSPMYFFSDEEAGRGQGQAELLPYLVDDGMRELVLRAAGLSERSLRAIRDMIENARAIEGVPDRDPEA